MSGKLFDCIPNLLPEQRMRLRVIAFVHDTFKYNEPRSRPRDWSRHHSVLAKEFLAQFTEDAASLLVTELHDEAYYAWQALKLHYNINHIKVRLESKLY